MHINNHTGWKTRFTASISVICFKSGLTNSTFKRARTELHSKGYIDYESRSGNQSAIYPIIYFHQKDEDHGVVQNIAIDEQEQRKAPKKDKLPNEIQFTTDNHLDYKHQEQSKQGKDLNHNVGPLLKQKETKQDPSTAAEDVLGDEILREIAHELTKSIKENMSIDWNLRASARAKMRITVRRLLKQYGYPPDLQKMAVETVVKQAELMAGNMNE